MSKGGLACNDEVDALNMCHIYNESYGAVQTYTQTYIYLSSLTECHGDACKISTYMSERIWLHDVIYSTLDSESSGLFVVITASGLTPSK